MGRRGGSSNRERSTVSSDVWDRLAESPSFLQVDQQSKQVVVTGDSDRPQTFFLDGKKHSEKDANGEKTSTKTEWQDGSLVAESKLSHSTKITQTFRLSENGRQLYVTSRLENPSLQAPVSIRRVYDLLGATTQQSSAAK